MRCYLQVIVLYVDYSSGTKYYPLYLFAERDGGESDSLPKVLSAHSHSPLKRFLKGLTPRRKGSPFGLYFNVVQALRSTG